MNNYQIIQGHVLDVLKQIPDNLVHCVITSPPYFPAIRDYHSDPVVWTDGWEGSLGDELTPFAYIDHLTSVFVEIKRIMRDDAVFWLNIGDTYAKNNKWSEYGIKRKDLIGMPWRIAFELQKKGFFLRQDNIWQKTNVMPESPPDRTTRSHEYIFQFTKSEKYYFDCEAIKEKPAESSLKRIAQKTFEQQKGGEKDYGRTKVNDYRSARRIIENFAKNPGRRKRTVWPMSTANSKGSHFAVFPEELVKTCILASTSQKGCCSQCGSQFVRSVNKIRFPTRPGVAIKKDVTKKSNRDPKRHCTITKTIGWLPSCDCVNETDIKPSIVLDPFSGYGTVGVVAVKLEKDYIGIELNTEYVHESKRRIQAIDALFVMNANICGQD